MSIIEGEDDNATNVYHPLHYIKHNDASQDDKGILMSIPKDK